MCVFELHLHILIVKDNIQFYRSLVLPITNMTDNRGSRNKVRPSIRSNLDLIVTVLRIIIKRTDVIRK